MSPGLIIIGGGKGAQLIIDWAKSTAWKIAGILDDNKEGEAFGHKILGAVSCLDAGGIIGKTLICSASSPRFRRHVWNLYHDDHNFINCFRSSVRYLRPDYGAGNVVFPDVSFDVFSVIGNNNVISAGSVIAHHCTIGSHNLFGPGVHLSGSVTIGDGNLIGSCVVVEPNVKIGNDCVIPSGTVVVKDLRDGTKITVRMGIDDRVYGGERKVRYA